MNELTEYKKQKWFKKEEPLLIKEIDLPKDNIGWLVIDSLGYGMAAGGIRLGKNVSLDEVKQLAAEMTLKFSFYKIPVGGAKAGIYCPSPITAGERADIFIGLGKSLKTLVRNNIYSPGTDMGTNQKDVAQVFKGAGIINKFEKDPLDSGYYTAISVFSTIKAIASFKSIELKGARIGIQGLGKVGINILHFAFAHGLKLVAASTQRGALYSADGLDVKQILDLIGKHGDDFVSVYNGEKIIQLEQFFEKEMDIMCPCAGIYPIHPRNVEKIASKIIVPGCNVAATQEVEKLLYERGITYLPGFVCNAGGALCYTSQRYGIKEQEISDFINLGIHRRIRNLLKQSKQSARAPADIARSIARKNQEMFALESKARMKGKLSLSFRLQHHGSVEMLRTILWSLIQRKLIGPNFLREYLKKRIVFERMFKGN